MGYIPRWGLLASMRGRRGRCDWRFADVLGAVDDFSDQAEVFRRLQFHENISLG